MRTADTFPSGERAIEQPESLWSALRRRTDLAQYRPRQAAEVVAAVVAEEGQELTVLRSPSGGYMQLSPAEAELWTAMDGTQTVADLATLGFVRFRQLLPVAGLVESLRQEGFLADPPVGIYTGLKARLERRTVAGWGRRVLDALRSHQFAIGGIDALAGWLHRWGGWLLFTRPALTLMALIVVVGLGAFGWVATGSERSYALIDTGNVGVSVLAFWVTLLLSFVLHELAHAVAVKHFGRRVLRGGVMIYFGMPAAFVDTSDIWLAGRRPRILVSLAGPLCDLLVGSLAALAAAFLPQGGMGGAAYRLAVAAYLAALCNLNPLLELDGYYIVSDWLRLPNMRRRALAFIGGPLWQKVRTRSALSGEERIFTLYGLLATVYTVLAVALALFFWQSQLVEVLAHLWNDSLIGRLAAAVIVLVLVVPLGLGLLVAAWGLVRAALAWLGRRGYGRNPALVAGGLGFLAVTLAALTLHFGVTVETMLVAPALWLVALGFQVILSADYKGAAVARALGCFLAVSLIAIVVLTERTFFFTGAGFWAVLEQLGFALLLFAGLVTLLDTDLRQAPPVELAASALLLALAFLAGGMTIGLAQAAQPDMPFLALVLQATPVYTSVVALALLLLQVAGLSDSGLVWSWLLLWLGIAAQAAAYVLQLLSGAALTPLALASAVLAAGLWAAAWCAHFVALRQTTPRQEPGWPLEPATGEGERLQRAFRHTYAGLYRMLLAYGGSRRAGALDDRLDVLAATANWGITLDREAARIGAELAALPLDVQGARYAEVLRYAVAEVERLAGATFARRAIQIAYDALPWPEREAADRRCFPATPWARELSRDFGDARAARLRLLREVDLFAACDDEELGALAAACEPRQVQAGARIYSSDEPAPGLWIIDAGEVALKTGAALASELHRGDWFGAGTTSATGPQPDGGAPRRYYASVHSDLLFVSKAELKRLLREEASHTAEGPTLAALVRDLERAPFFHDLPRATLRTLARSAERIRLPAKTPVIRQGRSSGRLYVLVTGEAVVFRRDDGATAQRLVARLGPTELFGEVELLRGTPPMASVVTLTAVELVAVPHSTVAELLMMGGAVAGGLERLGSGRVRGQ